MIIQVYVNVKKLKTMKQILKERFQKLAGIKPLYELKEEIKLFWKTHVFSWKF